MLEVGEESNAVKITSLFHNILHDHDCKTKSK